MLDGLIDFIITSHAVHELRRRGIRHADVALVLRAPEQRWTVRAGRDVFQSRVSIGSRLYLTRVFVDVERRPAEVVTAYRTSRWQRYWRTES